MARQSKDISILGAGILGLFAAYRLMCEGHKITLYDPKGFPADNASFMAGGMLAPYAEIEHMDEAWIEAGLAGIEGWRALDLECGFVQRGSVLVAHPDDLYMLERFRTHLPRALQGYYSAQAIEPDLAAQFENGLFLEQEAHVEPALAMRALVSALQGSAQMIERAVSPGELSADIVIDCRGMDADDPDLRGVKGEIALVRNTEFTLSRPVRLMHPRYPLYIVPRADHVFMVGATVIEAGADEAVSVRSTMELLSALYALSPSFAEAELLEVKAGIRPSYPDNLPRIHIAGGQISCNGSFRHGYLMAPVMADVVAGHLSGEESQYMSLFNKGYKSDEGDHQRGSKKLRSAA